MLKQSGGQPLAMGSIKVLAKNNGGPDKVTNNEKKHQIKQANSTTVQIGPL